MTVSLSILVRCSRICNWCSRKMFSILNVVLITRHMGCVWLKGMLSVLCAVLAVLFVRRYDRPYPLTVFDCAALCSSRAVLRHTCNVRCCLPALLYLSLTLSLSYSLTLLLSHSLTLSLSHSLTLSLS